MPLLDDRAELVPGESHAVEVGQANLPLHIFADETEFAEIGIRVVQVAKRNFIDSAFEEVA